MTRQINDAALNLIKSFESCSLEPYQDVAGVWTNGWGNTHGVTADSPDITQEQADADLLNNLATAEIAVESAISASLTDNQFGALVSLVFNAGAAVVQGTIGRLLNAGDYAGASDFFLRWDKVTINGVLTVSQGLLNRRLAEQKLFNT